MRNPKYYIAIDEYERGIIINSLNNLRNKLIADADTPMRLMMSL